MPESPIYRQYLREAAKRREKARKLREQGYTYQRIGQELGVTHQRARQMIVGS